MPITTAKAKFNLPAVSMTLEQFVALLQRLIAEFNPAKVRVRIEIVEGIQTLSYGDLGELVASDSHLPNIISGASVQISDGRPYDAMHMVTLEFTKGELFERNNASVEGPSAGWVNGVSSIIRQESWREATLQGRIRLRAILCIFCLIIFASSSALGALAKHTPRSAAEVFIVLTGACLFVVFTLNDSLYYAAFPTTTILVRVGTRKWPYETVILLLAIAGIVLPFVIR